MVRLVLRQLLFILAAGIPAGLCAAMWLSPYLRNQLYAVSPFDAGVHVTVAAVLAVVALAACLIPVRRAMKVDPTVAFRWE